MMFWPTVIELKSAPPWKATPSSAQQNAAFLEANGITISSPARWAVGNSCYSHGWALGRLKFFPAGQIDAAFLAGDLKPEDILLTDGVPSSMPLVAGVISLAPATPNSHVVILANTFQIPFAYLSVQEDVDQAAALAGRAVLPGSVAEAEPLRGPGLPTGRCCGRGFRGGCPGPAEAGAWAGGVRRSQWCGS